MATRRSFRRSTPRRKTTFMWAAGDLDASLINQVSVQFPLLSTVETALGGDLMGWTIRRILINGLITQRVSTVAGLTDNVYVGILWSTSGGVPAATVIDPGNPAEYYDWMYYEGFQVYTGPTMALNTRDPGEAQMVRFHRDIRTGRRHRDIGDVATVLAQNGNTDSSRLALSWRVLLSKA